MNWWQRLWSYDLMALYKSVYYYYYYYSPSAFVTTIIFIFMHNLMFFFFITSNTAQVQLYQLQQSKIDRYEGARNDGKWKCTALRACSYANPSNRSLPFLLQGWSPGFPGLFTDTSVYIRFFLFSFFFWFPLFSCWFVIRFGLDW